MFEPIKNTRAFEQVATQIKERIFSGQLIPGDRLAPEAQLAADFNVGRQTVREALRLLEMSGFIATQKGGGGGAFINDAIQGTIRDLFLDAFRMKKGSMEDLTLARIQVERNVLDLAMENFDESDAQKLKCNIAEARKRIDQGQTATEINVQFHKLLAQASKNFVYVIIMECIMAVHGRFLMQKEPSLETSSLVVDAHENIILAILDHNAGLAHKLFKEHLIEVRKRLEQEPEKL